MIKHQLLSTFIFLVFCFSLQAQHPCGTTLEEQATTPAFVERMYSGIQFEPRTVVEEVPIKIHIIGGANGIFAIDSSIVLEELALVNESFAAINVEFVPCGSINFIYNNAYLTFTKTVDEVICDINDVPGVINIYFPPDIENQEGEDICGYAYNFDVRPRVFVDKDCAANGSTFTHEMGHSFALLHTHSSFLGEELADGSNCATAGDFFCDTPADPRLTNSNVNDDCVYIGTELDAQQQPYSPDPTNIMSYAPKECRVNFTPQQLMHMESYYVSQGEFLPCSGLPTSTENLAEQLDIKVFPNPSHNVFFVKGLSGEVQLEIYNVKGQLLFSQGYQEASDKIEISNFANTSSGIYYLKITSETYSFTQKMIRL